MNTQGAVYRKSCFIQLSENDREIAGAVFSENYAKAVAQSLFEKSPRKQLKISGDQHYVTAEIDPADLSFQKFMLRESRNYKDRNEELYETDGFYKQRWDFFRHGSARTLKKC